MTKREAAIVSAYSGILLGDFTDLHEYIEEIMGRPVWTHELAAKEFSEELRIRSRHDFVSLEVV